MAPRRVAPSLATPSRAGVPMISLLVSAMLLLQLDHAVEIGVRLLHEEHVAGRERQLSLDAEVADAPVGRVHKRSEPLQPALLDRGALDGRRGDGLPARAAGPG